MMHGEYDSGGRAVEEGQCRKSSGGRVVEEE
jgi:hypothetical protein